MNLKFVVFAFILFIICGVARADEPVIIIDRWWGVDYAKVNCDIPAFQKDGESEPACVQEHTNNYNNFETEIKTQFAANPNCSGIKVLSFGYPRDPNDGKLDASIPHWSFSLNYNEQTHDKQLWQMLPPKGSKLPMVQAMGTPVQIAQQVCTIIKSKGGSVEH